MEITNEVNPTPVEVTNEVTVEPTPIEVHNELPEPRSVTKRVIREKGQIVRIEEEPDGE